MKISSYLDEQFTQRQLPSQKGEKNILALISAGFTAYIQKLNLVLTQWHKVASTLLGSIVSRVFLPHYHFHTVQTHLHAIYTPSFIYQQFFLGLFRTYGNIYFNDSFNQIQDKRPSNLIEFNLQTKHLPKQILISVAECVLRHLLVKKKKKYINHQNFQSY